MKHETWQEFLKDPAAAYQHYLNVCTTDYDERLRKQNEGRRKRKLPEKDAPSKMTYTEYRKSMKSHIMKRFDEAGKTRRLILQGMLKVSKHPENDYFKMLLGPKQEALETEIVAAKQKAWERGTPSLKNQQEVVTWVMNPQVQERFEKHNIKVDNYKFFKDPKYWEPIKWKLMRAEKKYDDSHATEADLRKQLSQGVSPVMEADKVLSQV